jgi:hypothetical protein
VQTIRGTVVDSASGQVVKGAYVGILNPAGSPLSRTVTDSAGRFMLRAPAAGRFQLRTELMGYGSLISHPIEVGWESTTTILLQVVFRPITIDSLTVVTSIGHLERAGFYDRRELGFGHFITRDRIEARLATNLIDLLRGYPGVSVVKIGPPSNDSDVVMRSGGQMFLRGTCLPSVAIDGKVVRRGGIEEAGLDAVLPSPLQVDAIELYLDGAGLPAWAAGGLSPCGAILVWTRRSG